ncbi:carboxypeptidase regulatory-like domain-containing protein [Parasegetibacter sp. NRK P23]|uniref:TonB-dependent receptor n=1 Tax=Parasegetibacter sp. NRK P23 TaxID=2942999 RepID=UPI002042EE82|nr:carboxypeptidase regulatory-like domain-containing protein [Parasegetibacter sp. NRK P23]MCM5528878.1 carboxypeptidase regulatory-like domain-containing protein [Parasegetibacter sp. NRK P23]
MLIKRILYLLALLVLPAAMFAQVTTSSMSGSVKAKNGEALVGATVKATHVPTGSVYTTTTRTGGRYDLANINPGGPYIIEISYVGYEKLVKSDIQLSLGETSKQDATLSNEGSQLSEVIVSSSRRNPQGAKGGAETNIGKDKMANLPTVGRNIADYLRYVPQTKITNDGGISIAGQNNRFNSFYIDGAVNNDVFGLAASGTNGGQAGIAPISIDAIDQFQVVLSPYDASLGNFTGGGINAITRSGTNKYEGSVYYFFRNQNLSGKTPGIDKSQAVKLSNFSNKTYGFRVGGPIIENKLFFFLNGEVQRDERPQPFNFDNYEGSLTQSDLTNLTNVLKNTYGYDPGGYLDNPEKVTADRIVAKVDWNINAIHRLSASYRMNKGERLNTSRSTNQNINFYNNGYAFPTLSNSGTLELNSRLKAGKSNRLLLTFTNVEDDRGAMGNPFPRVRIRDGSSNLYFGTEEFSTGNLLKQNNYALFDVFKLYAGSHSISIGTDNEFSKSYNVFIRQNYGSYDFPNLSAFLNGGSATTYNRSYSLVDDVTGDNSENAAAKFNTARLAFFVNDEIKVSDNFTLNLGVRADKAYFLTTAKTDKFFNDTALGAISQYYDLKGARSGQINNPKLSINPRIGFVYKINEEDITIRGGLGMFTGRVPLVWPGAIYNNNGVVIGGINASNVAFRPDPFDQYVASDFGQTLNIPSGEVNIISEDFRMNKVFRTSLAVDKNLGKGWKFTIEGIFTKNINEIDYKSVNILAPTGTSVGADQRNVYPLSGSFTARIPMRSNGSNPYTGVYLLSNNDGKKGYAYNFTASIDKSFKNGFALNANYSYGSSTVLNEGTSSQNSSQWRYMETVNGRNFITLSRSDFDQGHRINAFVSKKFSYAMNRLATTISLVYNGQSGSPYSYVMSRGMVRDLDNAEDNDLIYVPRNASEITFLQNGTLTPQQQWELFNAFIDGDKYLSKRRGQYAERNGARLPFTHVVDLKLQQDFNIKLAGRTYQLQVTYDVFNFTNMINRKWGTVYFANNDNYQLLQFDSYASASNLTPRFKFTPPTNNRPYTISDGVFNSSRWTSQLGFRITF